MTDGWFDRLIEVLENDRAGASMRAISIASGRGPNYLSQMIKNKKQPGAENLSRILDQFDQEIAVYVLTGIRISSRTLALVSMFEELSEESQDHFLNFLHTLAEREVDAEQEAVPHGLDD